MPFLVIARSHVTRQSSRHREKLKRLTGLPRQSYGLPRNDALDGSLAPLTTIASMPLKPFPLCTTIERLPSIPSKIQ